MLWMRLFKYHYIFKRGHELRKQSSRCILPYIIIIICYIYTALFWVLKALYIEGGHLLKHHQCAVNTWMMWRQPYCARTPTTHQLTGGCDEANQCMGIIRRLWWSEANGEILPGCRGLHPYSFSKDILGFLMTTESQGLGLTSHPKDGAFWQYSVPVTTLGR